MLELEGKVALITGGSRGIGAAMPRPSRSQRLSTYPAWSKPAYKT